jgi:hypothetical protein
MKKITFILFALIAGTTFAQNSAFDSATASAEIVAPISVTWNNAVLDFGLIAQDVANGDVVIDVNGARTIPAAMKVGVNTGYSVPTFTVSHGNDLAYGVETSITQPTAPAAGGLTLKTVTTSLASTTTTTADSFQIGATLSVLAGTTVGQYNDGAIKVTVTYN